MVPSFGAGDGDEETDAIISEEDEGSFELSKIFLIQHDHCFSYLWRVIHVINCVVSSYAYIWIAHFGDDAQDQLPWKLTVACEIIATLSIILRLLTTYVPEGGNLPVTDHYLIFKNY